MACARDTTRGLLMALLWVAAASPLLSGCELILEFDRDKIRDAAVRTDGNVVGEDGGTSD